MATDFDRDTALQRVDDATFTGRLHRRWWIVRGPNGGYLAAVMMRALQERLDDPSRRARSLTVHYLEAPAEGDVTITTGIERSGRSLSTLSATMEQGGRPVAKALAAFSRPRQAAEFNHLVMPDVLPPEDLPALQPMEGQSPPMTANFEMRPAVGAPPFSGAGEAVSGGWLRLRQPRPLDDPELAMLTDAWVPAVFSMMTVLGGVPTVDLTVHFRAALPPDTPPDAHYLVVFRSRVAADGFVEEDGEIWHRDGTLLAQSRQLAVLL